MGDDGRGGRGARGFRPFGSDGDDGADFGVALGKLVSGCVACGIAPDDVARMTIEQMRGALGCAHEMAMVMQLGMVQAMLGGKAPQGNVTYGEDA